jgi:hypothetical protein
MVRSYHVSIDVATDTWFVIRRGCLTALIVLTVAIAGCFGTVIFHDHRARLSRGELKERVERELYAGASDTEVSQFLARLRADDRADSATISHHPPRTVHQEDCSPRPCSLVDFGVPPGDREITAHIENPGSWLPSFCTDEYNASFILDDVGGYYRLIFEDAGFCL